MMFSGTSLSGSLILLVITSVAANVIYSPIRKICYDYSIPVNATNYALVATYQPFTSNYDVVEFVNDVAGGQSGRLNLFSNAPRQVSAVYTISATICIPTERSTTQKTVLLASAGLGYDRRYWDSEFQPANYSFVDFAIAQGYTVFFYDRLGTGKSSKVSGYQEPQAKTQVAILQQLTTLLRSGKYTGELGVPSKIIHVGHSYGSFLSNGLISATPQLSDGAILTGFGYGPVTGAFFEAFALRIASLQAPGKWPGRDNQYLTGADVAANVAMFFRGKTYDKEALWYTEAIKQPIATVELISVGSELIFPLISPAFNKPLLVLTAEFDLLFCAYNCSAALSNGGKTKAVYFPNATDFQTAEHPATGHAINFSYNATSAYKVITDYLKKNGL